MVRDTRILEASLGSGKKIIEKNERDSSIVQRRAIRAKTSISVPGNILTLCR